MKEIKTIDFEVMYSPSLKQNVENAIEFATMQKQILLNLFGEDIGVIKAAFFDTREAFERHIENISGGRLPPKTAYGCFYCNEIQCLIDENVKKDMTSVLAHEMAHLFFDKFVYQKFGVSRVRWLDESFACRFENPYQKTAKIKVLEMCEYISKKYPNFNMDRLSAGIPNEFNHNDAYSMFRIIAIYIEKNGKERDWISVFDKGQGKVKKLSKTILNDAIHDIKRN